MTEKKTLQKDVQEATSAIRRVHSILETHLQARSEETPRESAADGEESSLRALLGALGALCISLGATLTRLDATIDGVVPMQAADVPARTTTPSSNRWYAVVKGRDFQGVVQGPW